MTVFLSDLHFLSQPHCLSSPVGVSKVTDSNGTVVPALHSSLRDKANLLCLTLKGSVKLTLGLQWIALTESPESLQTGVEESLCLFRQTDSQLLIHISSLLRRYAAMLQVFHCIILTVATN